MTPLAAAVALILSPVAYAGTVVTNTGDSGAGSLRDAIINANADCASFTNNAPEISFNLAGAGPFTISVSTPLPMLYCGSDNYNPVVNGYSQPGSAVNGNATAFTPAIKVILNSNIGYGGGCGLQMEPAAGYAGALTVRGVQVQNFTSGVCGTIELYGSILKNNGYGADLYGPDSIIGSSGAADRNAIIGNTTAGVWISGNATTVDNNFIGTANGTTAAANGMGIYVNGSNGPYIVDNVISGNSDAGVYLSNDYGGTVVDNNKIGLNAAGSGKIANQGGGFYAFGGSDWTVSSNTISGNSGAGVAFDFSYNVAIIDNKIGLNNANADLPNTRGIDAYCSGYSSIADNTIAGNATEGVMLDGASSAYLDGNSIFRNKTHGVRLAQSDAFCYGGGTQLVGNDIHNNTGDGVLITDGIQNNRIHATPIYDNGRKNINLTNSSAALPNDAGDGDGGSNLQQNYPVISSVVQNGTSTAVGYTLTTADGSYIVEFFSNDTPGDPGGKTYVGNETVFVYGGTYTGTFSYGYGLLDNVSATATDINDNTSEFSAQKVATSGPAVSISPTTIDFGQVFVGNESPTRVSNIRSMGDVPLEINSISGSSFCYGGSFSASSVSAGVHAVAPSICYGGGFICETNCTDAPYAKGQSCRITARFAPTFPGPYSTSLYVCDNTAGSPRQVLLTGEAILPPPITISPRTWDFGPVALGSESESRKFTISNTNPSYGAPLELVEIASTSDFEVVGTTCGPFLYGGDTCEATVAFVPTASGDVSGTLNATYSSSMQPLVAPGVAAGPTPTYTAKSTLSGQGLSGGVLELPGPIELGAALVGGNPVIKVIDLRNTGFAPVTISSITVSAPFTLVNNCTAPIAPEASCSITVGFSATAVGEFNGSLTIVSDAAGGSGEVGVHATGQTIAAPLLRLTPASVGFGDRVIGSQSPSQTITITNIGGEAAALGATVASIDYLIAGNSCGTTLAPQTSCSVQVAFRPLLGFGQRISSFIVTSNAAGSPQSVTLIGTGCRPFVGMGNRTGESSNCAP